MILRESVFLVCIAADFIEMSLEQFKRLIGYVVLDLAGVLSSRIALNAEKSEEIGKDSVAFVDMFSNSLAFSRESNMVVGVNEHKTVILHLLEDDRDSRARISEI